MTAIAVILMKLAVMGIVVTLTDAKHVWTARAWYAAATLPRCAVMGIVVILTSVKHVWTARAKYAAATRI